jgi:cell division protein FtsB
LELRNIINQDIINFVKQIFNLKKMADVYETTPSEEQTKKELPIRIIAVAIILGLALIFLVVMYFDQRSKMNEMEMVLTQEKDSLANELRQLVVAYDTLKTNNDTLNAGLEKERNRIVQLLSVNASNAQLIKKYRSEITTMRNIMKSYIVQIDSLNTSNKNLVAENVQIREQISQVRSSNTELSKVREELSSKVEMASVIQAKDILAVPLNRKRKETSRVNLLENVRVCFTLRENPIASAGQKEVFMRVIRPDSLVISTSPDNIFEHNGNMVIYSASRTVDYTNQDVEMCIFMENTGDFITGNYSVELYLENNVIGRTNFILAR